MLHLLRIRARANVERRLRADLVGTGLEGGAGGREALSRLGVADQPVIVLAMAAGDPAGGARSVAWTPAWPRTGSAWPPKTAIA